MLHDPTNDESIITYLVSEIMDEKVEMSVELQKCIVINIQFNNQALILTFVSPNLLKYCIAYGKETTEILTLLPHKFV